MQSSQMCRPHFHTPLHPWISEGAKPPMVPHPAHGSAWCSPFSGKSPHGGSTGPPLHSGSLPPHSSPHLFSFPPTPPKDATPDTVTGSHGAPGSGDYAALGAGAPGSGEDVKGHHTPGGSMLGGCSGSSSKPREGSTAFSSVHHHHHQPPHHHHMPSHHYPPYVPPPPNAPTSSSSDHYAGAAYPFHSSLLGATAKSSSSMPSGSGGKPRSKGRSSAGKMTTNNLLGVIGCTNNQIKISVLGLTPFH